MRAEKKEMSMKTIKENNMDYDKKNGSEYGQHGQHEGGREHLEDLRTDLAVMRKAYGPKHKRVADLQSSIGQQHLRHNEYRCALDAYEAAVRIYRYNNFGGEIGNGNDLAGDVEDNVCKKKSEPYEKVEILESMNAAGVLNNMGLIHKRLCNYREAVEAYSEAMQIYKSCHAHILQFHGFGDDCVLSNHDAGSRVPDINLELKMTQTLQTMARIYAKFLHDFDSAVQCHQDAVTLLMDFDSEHDDQRDKFADININARVTSPTSVISLQNNVSNPCSTQNSNYSYEPTHSQSLNLNIIKLTEHERVRIVAASLNALAQIYIQQEYDDLSKHSSKHHNQQQQEKEEEDEEDALFYFQESLDFLRSVPNPSSTTSIPTLSDDNGATSKSTNDVTATNKTKRTNTSSSNNDGFYPIDLRVDVAHTLMDMGMLLRRRGRLKEAADFFLDSYLLRKDLYSTRHSHGCSDNDDDADEVDSHPDIVASCYALGLTYERLGKFSEAESCYQNVLAARREMPGGEEGIEVANVLINLSNVMRRRGDIDSSLEILEEAIVVYRKNAMEEGFLNVDSSGDYESGSPNAITDDVVDKDIATSQLRILRNLAGALQNRGTLQMQKNDAKGAIASYEEAMKIQKLNLGSEHPDVASTWDVLGDIFLGERLLEKARSCFCNSLELYRKFGTGENDPCVMAALENIKEVDRLIKLTRYPKTCIGKPPRRDNTAGAEPSAAKKWNNSKVTDDHNFLDQQWEEEDHEYCKIISTKPLSGDDSVSQLTFRDNDFNAIHNHYSNAGNGQGIQSYVTKTVGKIAEVTEEFFAGPSLPRERLPPLAEIKYGCENEFHGEGADDLPSAQGFELEDISALQLPSIKSGHGDKEDKNSPLGDDVRDEDGINAEDKNDENSGKIPLDMDDLLAQMNVVTCDMDGDGSAKPFKEIVKVERKDGTGFDLPPSEEEGQSPASINSRKSKQSEGKLRTLLELLKERRNQFGLCHPEVVRIMESLAKLYEGRGEKDRAIKIYLEILKIQKATLEESNEVAITFKTLGDLYTTKGDIDNAIEYYTKARDIQIFLYDENHPKVAHTLNSMGLAELERGDFDMAMDYLQQALKMQRTHLLPNEHNPDVSQTLVNIGAVYYKERNNLKKIRSNDDTYKDFIESGMLGKIAFAHGERGEYIMAMQFYEEVLQLLRNRGERRSLYGIATTLNCLGSLSVKTGRYVEAKEYHEQALRALKSVPDAAEIDLADTSALIAIVEYHSGNFRRALEIFDNILPIQRMVLGSDHARVARSIYHTGVIYKILVDYDKAMMQLDYSLRIQKSILQEDHPDTLNTLQCIGRIYLETEQFDMAYQQFAEILERQEQIFGGEHPEVADTIHLLGRVHAARGKISTAMKCYKRCHQIRSNLFSLDHPSVAHVMDSFGDITADSGNVEKALAIYEDSLRIRRDTLGDEHFELGYTLYRTGLLYTNMRKYSDAMSRFKEAMKVTVGAFGLHHVFVADIYLGVGHLNMHRCHFDEAKNDFEKSLQLYRVCKLGNNHPKIVGALNAIARVEHEEELCV